MRSSRPVLWTISLACALTLSALPARAESDAQQSPSALAQWQDTLGLSGTVRASEFSKDASFSDETGYTVGSVWVTAKPKEFWGIKTYFDARVQAQDLTRNSKASWDLREGYAQKTLGNLDVRVGRQIIVWGRADKVNPTDSWSTREYTLLAPSDDDQRLGVTSMQATWNAGPYRLIALWQPEWRYPSLPIPPLPPGLSLRNVAPSDSLQQVGFKIDHSGEGLDWSVSYAHVLDRMPDLAILPTPVQGLPVGLIYRPVSVVGADAAIPMGQYGLRGEIAYTRTENQDAPNAITKRPNLFAVLGVERTFNGELNINLQYLYRRTFDFVPLSSYSNPTTRLLADQVDLLSNQLAPDMQGASLRINYKAFNETLEFEIAGVTWFHRGDSAIDPKVSYAFTDHLKAIVGGQLYHGPTESFFGRLGPTSNAYAEVQVGF
jgi:hypothetical protein